MASKCGICGQNESILAWQPFGPDENPKRAFTTLGGHYRGFSVVKVCQLCHDDIQATGVAAPAVIVFRAKGQWFGYSPVDNRIDPSPF